MSRVKELLLLLFAIFLVPSICDEKNQSEIKSGVSIYSSFKISYIKFETFLPLLVHCITELKLFCHMDYLINKLIF